MDVLDLARWQFGITTVYHFVLVPLTIGLSTLVAIMQTMWFKTGNEKWLRLTKFYGKLLLINFALGVATGIVQEFQFGMNWSEYSRYVGDVFGAPLAMEALIAFFLESTFLGLWIFGWDRLPKAVHLATIWMLALGSILSAFFIIAANSWMQHPVGAVFNPETGRAEMNDIVAVLTNKTALVAYPHVIATAFLVAGTFVCGIAVFWMVRKARADKADADLPMYRTAARFGAWVMIISGVGILITGDEQAKLMFQQQPIKMAAAEALCDTEQPAAFSILSVGHLGATDCNDVKTVIKIPGLLSFLATGDWNAEVTGLNDLQPQYAERYGATTPDGETIHYQPNLAHHVLVLPPHDWARGVLRGARSCRAVGHAQEAVRRPALARDARLGGTADAVHGREFWLDLHRDGPPTVCGRPQPNRLGRDLPADPIRGLDGGLVWHGAGLDDHLHARLRDARRVLVPPDAPLRD